MIQALCQDLIESINICIKMTFIQIVSFPFNHCLPKRISIDVFSVNQFTLAGIPNQSDPYFPDNISVVGKLIICPYHSIADLYF